MYLWASGVYADLPTALRHASFNTVSMATTLGLATQDFAVWPMPAGLWLLLLCSFSSCAGSTGGGVKMLRAMILYRQTQREMLKLLHPAAESPVRIGEAVVPNKVVFAVLAFGFVYMASLVFITLALVAGGLDLLSAFSAAVACVNNTGPGLGAVGPASNYAMLTDAQTWVCTFAMLLRRLEFLTLLVVLTPGFWRK